MLTAACSKAFSPLSLTYLCSVISFRKHFLNSSTAFRSLPSLQFSTYSGDLFRVTLGVLKVRGSPAPLPAPLPSGWTLQKPPCQCLIQLQHGLPVRHRAIFVVQLHISLRRNPFWRLDGSRFFQNEGPQWALLTSEDVSVTVGLENKSRQSLRVQWFGSFSIRPPCFGCCSQFGVERWTRHTPAT